MTPRELVAEALCRALREALGPACAPRWLKPDVLANEDGFLCLRLGAWREHGPRVLRSAAWVEHGIAVVASAEWIRGAHVEVRAAQFDMADLGLLFPEAI